MHASVDAQKMAAAEGIAVIILAAGGSIRLGRPKQLLPFRGRTLLRHAAETALASACRPVIVVLGAHAGQIEGELNGLSVTRVTNLHWESGMSSSIGTGLKALDAAQTEAMILMVCDQPMISPQLLNRLAALHQSTGRGIVAAQYAGTMGVPVLFSRPYFAELAALPSPGGAKSLIVKYNQDVAAVPFPEGALDIDTEDDVGRMETSKFKLQNPKAFRSERISGHQARQPFTEAAAASAAFARV